jgi:formylmethanofuran dehydrogenase subunit D
LQKGERRIMAMRISTMFHSRYALDSSGAACVDAAMQQELQEGRRPALIFARDEVVQAVTGSLPQKDGLVYMHVGKFGQIRLMPDHLSTDIPSFVLVSPVYTTSGCTQ